MALGEKAKKSYDRYQDEKKKKKKFDTAKEHYETIKRIADEDTRSSELFKQSVKYLIKIGEKIFGKALSKHPYYLFHKAHLEALGKALEASDTHHNAMKALEKAVSAADATAEIAKQVSRFENEKNSLKLQYTVFLYDLMDLRRDLVHSPAQAAIDLQQSGYTRDTLHTTIEAELLEWRAEAALQYFDASELFAMVEVEYRAATAAYKKYQEKLKKLGNGVAGLAAERKRQLEWAGRVLDEQRSGSQPSSDAIKDPSLYAQRQRDKVEEILLKLAKICDVAMSNEAYSSLVVQTRLASL
jgi:hypothetical protein